LDERLQDGSVAVASVHSGHEFIPHARRIGAADVVAFEQNLVATADAHHLVAEAVNAGGVIPGAEE
jgi:hypothetical protein